MKKKYGIVVIFVAMIVSLAADQGIKEQGILAYNDHFFSASTRYFTQYRNSIEKVNPGYIESTLLLVRSLVQEKKYNEAQQILKSYDAAFLTVDAKYGLMNNELAFWHGYFAMLAGNYEQADNAFVAVLTKEVDDELKVKVLSSQAESKFLQKKFEEASNLYFLLADSYGFRAEGCDALVKIVQLFLLDKQHYFWAERMIARLKAQGNVDSIRAGKWLEITYLSLKGDSKGALKLFKEGNEVYKHRDSNVFTGAYYLGELMLRKQDYSSAVLAFSQAILAAVSVEDSEKVMLKLADAYIKNGQLSDAAHTYQEYLKRYANSTEHYFVMLSLGNLQRRRGLFSKAQDLLESVVKNAVDADTKYKAQMELASNYIDQNLTQLAIDAYLKSSELTSKNSEKARAIFLAGEEAYKNELFDQASNFYKKVADEFSSGTYAESARFYEGVTQMKRDSYAQAEGVFLKFLKDYPNSSLKEVALFQIGLGQKLQKKYSEAERTFNDLVTNFPESANALKSRLLQAECLSKESKHKEACDTLVGALKNYVNDAYISYLYPRLFQLYLVLSDDEAALKLADDFLLLELDSEQKAEVIYLLGDYWYNKRSYHKAAKYYNLFVSKFPNHSRTFVAWYQAAISTANFDKAQAVKILREINLLPNLDDIRRGEVILAIANYESDLGNYQSALEILEKANVEAKDSNLYKVLRGRLGDMYFILGDNSKAQAVYESLLKITASTSMREQVQFKLSEVYSEQKNFEGFEKLLQDIIYQYRSDIAEGKVKNWQYFVRAVYVLSDYYVRVDENEKAVAVLERLASLKQIPTSREAEARIAIIRGI